MAPDLETLMQKIKELRLLEEASVSDLLKELGIDSFSEEQVNATLRALGVEPGDYTSAQELVASLMQKMDPDMRLQLEKVLSGLLRE